MKPNPRIVSPLPVGPLLGFDASATVAERTGIGAAAAHLLSALALELPENWRMRVLVNSGRHPLPEGDPWRRASNLEVRHTRWPGRALLRGWQHLRFPPIELLLGGIDLYHSPASYIAPTLKARQVVTVHDLYFLDNPEHDDPFGGTYFARTFPRGLRRCARIIADSEHTKGRIVAAFGVAPEQITVIHLGVDRGVFSPSVGAEDGAITERWSGGKPYLLCVATIGPVRKNLEGLSDAYALSRGRAPDLPGLLIVGPTGNREVERRLRERLEALGISAHVRLTGYVPASDLPALYRHARALVIPSLEEGFGLPALEAMGCGCPVLAADAGSLREVAGNAAMMMEAASREAMASAILRVCAEESLRERLRAAGLERVKRFSWSSAARATLEVYGEVLGEKI